MKHFAVFSAVYLGLALGVSAYFRDVGLWTLVVQAWGTIAGMLAFWHWILGFVVVLTAANALIGRKISDAYLGALGYALLGCLLFQAGFIALKTSIPFVVPFFADPFWAELDKSLHGGTDPFEFTYALDGVLPVAGLLPLYLWVWLVPAVFFPMILVLTDADQARIRRFMFLFVLTWVALGNVLALAGSSVGPVYYDRLLGGDRFELLGAAFATASFTSEPIWTIQEFLWSTYRDTPQLIGSGISAFPSVHVGMAAVFAVYLWEHSGMLGLLGVIYLIIIQFLSVYTGYHYAVDGYISIILVVVLWLGGRRSRAS